ncbi:hypothetical protein GJ496_008574 [Pomphorhynchus laevis]|nr:hypothetical protein GJ496_008574 [Pomphorhynchus laevis]
MTASSSNENDIYDVIENIKEKHQSNVYDNTFMEYFIHFYEKYYKLYYRQNFLIGLELGFYTGYLKSGDVQLKEKCPQLLWLLNRACEDFRNFKDISQNLSTIRDQFAQITECKSSRNSRCRNGNPDDKAKRLRRGCLINRVKSKSQTGFTLEENETSGSKDEAKDSVESIDNIYCIDKHLKNIRVLYFNALSLRHKTDKLVEITAQRDFDLVPISETWFSQEFCDAELNLLNYQLIWSDRVCSRTGGGVALSILKTFYVTVIEEYKHERDIAETLWFLIKTTTG